MPIDMMQRQATQALKEELESLQLEVPVGELHRIAADYVKNPTTFALALAVYLNAMCEDVPSLSDRATLLVLADKVKEFGIIKFEKPDV